MKVSICLITYNHEDYLDKAIESVINQLTTFTTELVIGEDGSKDKTREICERYRQLYPDIIRLLPAEKNLGMMGNFLRTLAACTGDFVAFIEGDDYWIDPLKLEKQVSFLKKNPEYSACFHNALVKSTKNNIASEWLFHIKMEKNSFETEDLIAQWFVPSASVVFRKYPDFVLPAWYPFCKSGDIPFLLLLSLRGKLKYLDEVMSVYRVHDKGMSSTHTGYEKVIGMIFIYENFNIYTQYKHRNKIKEAIIYEINTHLPLHREIKVEKNADKKNVVSKVYKKLKKMLSYES
jgi:glycosyltransferase involved in cell wall biosynthesis